MADPTPQTSHRVALAYSGGLDTSYCVLLLTQRGHEVTAVTVDTGGFEPGEIETLGEKARSLGAVDHVTIDGRQAVYDRFVSYLIKANVLRGGVYPLCVAAERVQQAIEVAALARARGLTAVGHGSTGAGNDQVRFDAAIRTVAPEMEVVAPIRDENIARSASAAALRAAGFPVEEKTETYSINVSLWGTTIGGKETHDPWREPPEDVYRLTRGPEAWDEPLEVTLGFERGLPTHLDGAPCAGPELVAVLNDLAGRRGVGRGIHVGDTILGIKGRIAFEAPAPIVLITAHHELEKLVLTRWQQHWKETLGAAYGRFVHEGLYFEPVLRDLEAFFDHNQERVTGDVRVRLAHGRAQVTGARSPYSLLAEDVARYGEDNAYWNGPDARGFCKLYALQPAIWARRGGAGQANG